MPQKRLRVFISANSTEFKHFRHVATEELLRQNCDPVAMDHFSTLAGNLSDLLKNKIAECDAVICLIGHSFGAAAPVPSGSAARSYTQLEYDVAKKLGKPTFIFMSSELSDVAAGTISMRAHQEEFRREIKNSGLIWHEFATEDEFRRRILGIDWQLLTEKKAPVPQKLKSGGASPVSRWGLIGSVALLLVLVGVWRFAPSSPSLESANIPPTPKPQDAHISSTEPIVQKPAPPPEPVESPPPPEPAIEEKLPQILGQSVPVTLAPGIVKEFVWCPPGSFAMGFRTNEGGSTAEDRQDAPPQDIVFKEGFWIARHELTVGEAKALASATNFLQVATAGGADGMPLHGVSWDDAANLTEWLTKRRTDNCEVSLPRECEWEYAARAGTKTPYSFGTELDGEQANCDGKFPFSALRSTIAQGRNIGEPVAVGSYGPNAWGIFDMHGNVREWCSDFYSRAYSYLGGLAMSGPSHGTQRVLRGGYWNSFARNCRSGARDHAAPNIAVEGAGIRLVIRPAKAR